MIFNYFVEDLSMEVVMVYYLFLEIYARMDYDYTTKEI